MSRDRERFDEPTRQWLDELTDDGRAFVVVRDADSNTIWVSENAEQVLGMPRGEFDNRFYSLVTPGDQQMLFDLSRAMRHEGADVGATTLRLVHPDGRVQAFHLRVLDRLDDPAIRGLVATLRPASVPTELGDDLLRGLLMVSADLVVIQTATFDTTFVSPNVERLLGVTPDQLRSSGIDLVHPDDRGTFTRARARAVDDGSDQRVRVRLRHTDGSHRSFDTVITNRLDDPTIGGVLIVAREVSDLAATEAELAATRAVFEAIVSNNPDVSLTMDPDGRISFCGANVRTQLGHAPEDLVGRDAFDFVHPDDREIAARSFGRLVDGMEDEGMDPVVRLHCADGSWLSAEVVATDCTDVPGVEGYIVSLRDVTDRLQQQRRYRHMLRHASGAAGIIDPQGRLRWVSHGIETYVGNLRTIEEAVDHGLFESHTPGVEGPEVFDEVLRLGPGTTRRLFGRMGPPGEEKRWVDLVLTNVTDDEAVAGIILNVRDVDEAFRATEAGNRLTQVLESTSDLALIFDRDLDVIWANGAARALLGPAPLSREALLHRTAAGTRHLLEHEVLPSLVADGTWRGELTVQAPDERPIPTDATLHAHRDRSGDIEFVSAIARDISERKALEERLHAKARHDPLTGLPNRVLLMEQLERLLANHRVALLFLDLDQFKEVNDTQGHEVGDRLLMATAQRLRAAAGPRDLVARFGGDEFTVVFHDVDDTAEAQRLAREVLDAIRGPVQLGAFEVFLTASVGVALSGDDASDLVARADTAMYASKHQGRDQVTVYTDDLRAHAVRRLDTAQQLRRALERGELDVWFQPIIDSTLGVPISLEALVRWHHPTRGVVSPAQFIDVAEETGLVVSLGAEVLRRTCETVRGLGDAAAGLTVSVNISARQLTDQDLPGLLGGLFDQHGIGPERFCLEITESDVMQDLAASTQALHALRSLGVSIAVDDFGTGYSSLAYLGRFPVDELKIDREFVWPLSLASDWDRSLAGAIVSLGHSLGLRVVAEGVETVEQADILGRLGCDALQGFLFAHPVPAAELPDVLARLDRPPRAVSRR